MTLIALTTGLLLMLVSSLGYVVTRDKIHPAVIFPSVWAVSLIIIAFLPLLGFLPIEGEALLLFLGGGIAFSCVAVITQQLLSSRIYPPKPINIEPLNIKSLVFFLFFTNLVVLYFTVIDFMSLGETLSQAAYMVRRASIHGEAVFNPLITNYMLLGLVVIPMLSTSLIKRQLNLVPYLIIALPWATLILLVSGRAGLIQLLLVLFFIYYLLVRKISAKLVLFGFVVFLLIIVAGALAVAKVEMTADQSFGDIFVLFVNHVSAYAFQGPILFSQYYNGDVIVSPNWSPFRTIQHILSLFQLMPSPPPQHLEFNRFGSEVNMDGNVYSLYFSLYPNYGLLGGFIILVGYAAISTYIYIRAKSGNLVYILLSGYLFSAMILSIFADLFLPSLWFFIKLVIIIAVIKFLMSFGSYSEKGK